MIVFIITCLIMAILVQSQSPFLELLIDPISTGIGMLIIAASLLIGYLKKLPSIKWHDGFVTGCLIVWYGYWKPQFSEDAPMFFFFPVYYALLTSFVTLGLIIKVPNFTYESVEYLRYMEKISRFDISWLIGFVLVSILITRHYALYPMAMTFFILRHTMLVCLEAVEKG